MNNIHTKAINAQRREVRDALYNLLILIGLKRAEDGLHRKFPFQWDNHRGQSWYEARIRDDRLVLYERGEPAYGIQVIEAVSLRERLAGIIEIPKTAHDKLRDFFAD